MTRPFADHWRNLSASPVARHCVGLASLLLFLCAILAQLAIDWHTVSSGWAQTSALDAVKLESLKMSTIPLRGAEGRLTKTSAAIDDFYARRIPISYSQISSRIVSIGISSGVQLSHLTYDQRVRGSYLAEISIESQVSGTYPQIMRFVNGLERDQACFVIRTMALTGQQGGEVNLQLRFSTWLRPEGHAALEVAVTRHANGQGDAQKESQ